ncbi:MAG: pentapeptide repeat-containing protein [Planctomycetia bacterium]|nr:pentapeptide repeat-containing protein [Planctomycetia bacterium]
MQRADLRRVNLLGANVRGADWYLVDLRGATYSRDQEEHFRRCRAILGPGERA